MTQTDPHTENMEHKSYSVEELQVVGEQLLTKVKELIHEGNVRRIIIKQEGRIILEIPLTIGVASVVLVPVLAAIGVLGALIAQCSIEVVRTNKLSDGLADELNPKITPEPFGESSTSF
jgi:Domain of unknown function (DUF4342)